MDKKSLKILEYDKIISVLSKYAVSEMGREMLNQLHPSSDFQEVSDALVEAEDTVNFIKRRGAPSIDGISDTGAPLKRAELGGVLNPAELLKICDNLKVAGRLKEHLEQDNLKTSGNLFEGLIRGLYQNKRLTDKIVNAILNEEEISDYASPELYAVRRQILSLGENIRERLNEMIRSVKYQKYIQEPVVTLRGDRYVIPVKQEHRNDVPGLIHDSSASGATIFVEPMVIVDINNRIKEARIREMQEIEKILKELTAEVVSCVEGLRGNLGILARIDFLFAKARFALDIKGITPELNRDGKVRIVQGRHPLLAPEKVVPIDFRIGEDFDTLIVTGPNTGGKTVSLKTVGLFVLMTQSGIPIPANPGTKMAIYRNVFADIGDEQSIEQNLSTFSSHMKNIVHILSQAKVGDLALFDELGAGTDPQEGAALAVSILEFLHERKIATIATTHYSELKLFALSRTGIENASCEFDVETLRPTYKLLIGVPGKSNAFSISKKLGLQEFVLNRAREFISKEEIQFEDVLAGLEKNLQDARREREEADQLMARLKRQEQELLIEMEKAKEKRDKILQKANEQARRALTDSVHEVEALIRELKENARNTEGEKGLQEARDVKGRLMKKIRDANRLLTAEDEEDQEDWEGRSQEGIHLDGGISPGHTVLLKGLNVEATVLGTPNKDGNVQIQAGSMKMFVHLNQLRPLKQKERKQAKVSHKIGSMAVEKAKNIRSEIDVRGTTVDEAVLILDKYLDDAHLGGLSDVRIIHGKGTGALRQGIHGFLKSHHHVSAFRSGLFGEGENGVTIVTLK